MATLIKLFPVGKIAEKAVYRSVLSAELTKMHSFRLFILVILPTGLFYIWKFIDAIWQYDCAFWGDSRKVKKEFSLVASKPLIFFFIISYYYGLQRRIPASLTCVRTVELAHITTMGRQHVFVKQDTKVKRVKVSGKYHLSLLKRECLFKRIRIQ